MFLSLYTKDPPFTLTVLASKLTWSHFVSFWICRKLSQKVTAQSFHLYFLNIKPYLYCSNSSWKKVLWRWQFELVCAVPAWHPVQHPPSSAAPAHPTPIPAGEHLFLWGLKRLMATGAPALVQKTASLWRSHSIKVSWHYREPRLSWFWFHFLFADVLLVYFPDTKKIVNLHFMLDLKTVL